MSDVLEMDQFKHNIDLRAYAATYGYALDKRTSWRGSAVMRDARGDKIVIKRDSDGHFIYFSVRDHRDNGSIIDFLRHRSALNLGEIRKQLRAWSGGNVIPFLWPRLESTPKDRMRVEQRYQTMRDAPRHPYLEDVRGLPQSLLSSHRFAGRVRIDRFRNAVFPHFNASGLCGYELKNRAFTGFSAGGEKGLWSSHGTPDDRRLVVAESAIDALSHAALFPDTSARYVSIGGKPNLQQPELLLMIMKHLVPGAEVVSAMDNDVEGMKLSNIIQNAVQRSGRQDLTFRVHVPVPPGKDWNDVLLQSLHMLSIDPTPPDEHLHAP